MVRGEGGRSSTGGGGIDDSDIVGGMIVGSARGDSGIEVEAALEDVAVDPAKFSDDSGATSAVAKLMAEEDHGTWTDSLTASKAAETQRSRRHIIDTVPFHNKVIIGLTFKV